MVRLFSGHSFNLTHESMASNGPIPIDGECAGTFIIPFYGRVD